MGKYKENPMYNIFSIRVSDEEKSAIDEISRSTRKSISVLMREAIHHYGPFMDVATGR